jgi:hypothetical protein
VLPATHKEQRRLMMQCDRRVALPEAIVAEDQMCISWEAATAIGTVFLGTVAVIPIVLAPYQSHRRRLFHIKQVNMQLSVLHKKIEAVLEKKSWSQFNKVAFEATNKVNFDSIELLFATSNVLRAGEQEELRAFCLFFKPYKNMKTQPEFIRMKKEVEEILVHFPSKNTRVKKPKIPHISV